MENNHDPITCENSVPCLDCEIANEVPREMCIKIFYSESNGGYNYDVYESETPDEDEESIDGGLCTGMFSDAVEMATQMAMEIAKRKK